MLVWSSLEIRCVKNPAWILEAYVISNLALSISRTAVMPKIKAYHRIHAVNSADSVESEESQAPLPLCPVLLWYYQARFYVFI